MNSELRLKISVLAGKEWPKLVTGPQLGHPDRVEQTQREKWPRFERSMEYANKQLEQKTLPGYREMVRVFIEKLYLAQPSTRDHLTELVTFVAVWDQWIADALPPEVLNRLVHSEKRLYPFYEDLETQFTTLQREL